MELSIEKNKQLLNRFLEKTLKDMDRATCEFEPEISGYEYATIESISRGVIHVKGFKAVSYEELISLPGGRLGIAFDLDMDETGVILLDKETNLRSGDEVTRTGRVLDVPVGSSVIGRVMDGIGRPLDDRGKLDTESRRQLEKIAPGIMDRSPVNVPLQTGLKVVDALIPVGRGQRELIIGDRHTGKTAIAVDTIINQRDKNVICIYCAVGKRNDAVAKVIHDLNRFKCMDYSLVITATGDDPPALQFCAPYCAMSMAEHFMHNGKDVLVVIDDITRHAIAYRELSLLLKRPPGREAYPGDIFYIHSRLLERSTHLKKDLGGGSVTALPIVETEAQNISAYIPTNLISITDGQIYTSPDLFHKGILPPVDVGKSVSRVGGKTQLPAYREVAGDLKLSYSQFEELEAFAKFGTKLDEETKKTLQRGHRVRQVLKQDQYSPLSTSQQLTSLMGVSKGLFDDIPADNITKIEKSLTENIEKIGEISEKINKGEKLEKKEKERIIEFIKNHLPEDNGEKEKAKYGNSS